LKRISYTIITLTNEVFWRNRFFNRISLFR
jgi:hypothetical protein